MIQINCKMVRNGLEILNTTYGDFDSLYDAAEEILKTARKLACLTDEDNYNYGESYFHQFHQRPYEMVGGNEFQCDFLEINQCFHDDELNYDYNEAEELFGETEHDFILEYYESLAYEKEFSIVEYDDYGKSDKVINSVSWEIVATPSKNVSDMERYLKTY